MQDDEEKDVDEIADDDEDEPDAKFGDWDGYRPRKKKARL